MPSTFEKIDLGILAKHETFRRLAWLGRHEWLSISPETGRKISVKFPFAQRNPVTGEETTFLPPPDTSISYAEYAALNATIGFIRKSKLTSEAIWIWTLGNLFASGPKLFRPTLEQCMAMAEVELNIPLKEYRQPYPVIIYQYPEEFRTYMTGKLGVARFPKVAVCHHHVASNFMQVSSLFGEGDAITALIPDRNDDESIETILTRRTGVQIDANEAEFQLGVTLQRIALNFSLMMTHFKVKHKPMDQPAWEKLALKEVSLIEFEQHIEFYEEQTETVRDGEEPTGRHVKPHWRKGHWKMQAHGPRLSLRKPKFIKSLMVKKELFVGERSDTSVVYEGKNRVFPP